MQLMQQYLSCLINAIIPSSGSMLFPSSYSPPPTDKNVIMRQLHPIQQHIYHQNEQVDDMNNVSDGKNVFSMTLPSFISNKITTWISFDSGCY